MPSIRTVASLIAAVTVLQLSIGLLGVHIPLAARADSISRAGVGLISAAYAAGFMAGAAAGPFLLARVGHIRVFAAAGALAAALTLWLHWAGGLAGWGVLRLAAGFAVALLFISAESWMNGSLGKAERGGVLGFYHVCTKLALTVGPFLVLGAGASAPEPMLVAGSCFALAILPICLTSRAQPEPPKAQPLAISALFATAPAAVIACFGAGLINAGVLAFSPLFAERSFGASAAAVFQGAAWGGALLLQWPAGRLSDRIDRRGVIAALVLSSGLAALAMALLGQGLGFAGASILFALWGAGGALLLRRRGGAHGRPRGGEPDQPRHFGPPVRLGGGLDPGAGGRGGADGAVRPARPVLVRRRRVSRGGAAMFVRRVARAAPPEKTPFANKPATSVAAAELSYGAREEEAAGAQRPGIGASSPSAPLT